MTKLEIIDNPKDWFGFLDNRNFIAHTYNEKLADKVYCQALKFPEKIDNLLKKVLNMP